LCTPVDEDGENSVGIEAKLEMHDDGIVLERREEQLACLKVPEKNLIFHCREQPPAIGTKTN
jgi:hypothetical protein